MKPADELTDIFLTAANALNQRTTEYLQQRGVTRAQHQALTHLARVKTSTMTDLARHMGHTTAASTGLVDRMVTLGLVERASVEGDRRQIAVLLAEAGAGLLEGVRAVVREQVEQVIESMPKSDALTLMGLARVIHTALTAA